MAQELGLFDKRGLKVQLSREVGWATVRDKIIYRELDAAHALAPMVFAASLGLGSAQADCLTGLVLSLNGNAITLAKPLQNAGVGIDLPLRLFVRQRNEPLVLGIPFLYSAHHFVFRDWLLSQGLDPTRDFQFVVVPPPQMPSNLKAGHLDGFCVGEPLNSVAQRAGFGWRAGTSAQIAPQHPEKVLMVRSEFAETRAAEHEALIAALVEACRFCYVPRNRERVIETLGEPRYVNAPASALREGCQFTLGQTDTTGYNAFEHEPSAEKAAWIFDHLGACGLLTDPILHRDDKIAGIFRADIFRSSTQLPRAPDSQEPLATPDPSHKT
jgi:ABC-type nitrate/sulfonate/bicarbonate transport system substrate-binding protein